MKNDSLAICELRNLGLSRHGRLTVRLDRGTACSTGGATGRSTLEGDDVDVVAGAGPVSVVKVVEATAIALSPDSRWAVSHSAVGTQAEARGIDGTGLGWVVKLELVVGSNVASSASLIFHDTVCQGDGERSVELTLSMG